MVPIRQLVKQWMTRTTALLVLTILACTPVHSAELPDPGRLGDGQFGAVLEAIRAAYELPALAGFILKESEVRELAATGRRRADADTAVTVDDAWHIGSNTKAMTATLAAIYVERGKLAWDATLAELFPEWAGTMQAAYGHATYEDLLTHRAGLPANDGAAYRMDGRAAFARHALALEPANPRGTFLYSNIGYILAGHVLERIAGKNWEALITEEIFAPLDMRHTGFGPPGADGIPAPWGHVYTRGNWAPRDPSKPGADNPALLGPAGTVHTRLSDYAKFVQLHLAAARGDARILTPASFTKLHTPPAGADYALGWGCLERSWGGGAVLSHSGSNTMWFATVWLAPERNFAVFAVTNAAGDDVPEAIDKTCWALIQRVRAAAE